MTYCAGDVVHWYGDPVLLLSTPSGEGCCHATYLRVTGDKIVKPFGLIKSFYEANEKHPWEGDLTDSELALVTAIKLGAKLRIEGDFVKWP